MLSFAYKILKHFGPVYCLNTNKNILEILKINNAWFEGNWWENVILWVAPAGLHPTSTT